MQKAEHTGYTGEEVPRTAALFSAATEGIVFQDANGRIETCNLPAERIFGLTPGRMASAPWVQPDWQAIHEDGSQFSGEEHPATVTLRTGQPLSGIVMGVYTPVGTLAWISVNSRPILHAGKLHAVVTTFTDITARKMSEHALTANEERWKLAVAGSRDGIWDWNAEADEVFFSSRWKEILGFDDHEIGSSQSEWKDRIHPEDRPSVLAVLESHLAGRCPFYETEYRLRCKDGSWKWVLARGTVVSRGPGGKPLRFLGAITDITERKKIEDDLRKSEARFAALFRSSPTPIGILDLSTNRLIDVNDAWVSGTGYLRDEAIGHSTADLGIVSDENLQRAVSRLEGQGLLRNYELEFRRRDGSVRAGLLSSELLHLDGKPCAITTTLDITDRKRVEQALGERERQFRALTENSKIGVYSIRDGKIAYANPALANGIGYEIDEIIGADPLKFVDPRDHALVAENFRRRREYETPPDSYVFRARCKNGATKHIEVFPALVEMDGPPTIIGHMVDVTARKHAEEALREANQHFLSVASCVPDVIWSMDLSGRFTYVSPSVERTYGWTVEECLKFTREDWRTRAHFEKDAILIKQELENALSPHDRNRVVTVESEHMRKDGTTFWVEISASLIWSEDGRPVGMTGIARDITERKRAEEERMRLAAAIEQAAETVVITDASANILYANPAFERTTGYTVAEGLGKNPRFLKSSKQDNNFYREMWDVLTRGEVWRGRFYNQRKDGALYLEDATISPVRNESGRIVNYIAVKLDVTREAELQTQLSQAQKMESVGRLAGGVAHDFNNLLTIINGYSRMALNKLRADDPLREQLEEILKAGESATGLTRQLLAFSRQQVLQPRVLDLNRVVEGMQSMLQRLVGEDVDVRVALKADGAMVHADPHQLEQVIMNLAVNARDAMPNGGHLFIETNLVQWDESYAKSYPDIRAGRYALLAVSDTGAGINEATRQRIFEPFFTTKGTGQGTGLGLSMVQGIVAQSGGHVNVYSEPGRGTTFKIYLPALAGAVADPEKGGTALVSHGTETILVVEDQAKVRTFAVAVLKDYGYRVMAAANAVEALTICEREDTRIDMVLTDVVMPQMSGVELVIQLAALRPGIKTLLMSGYTDNVMVQHALLSEGAHFIEKPFSPKDLARRVREVLGSTAPAARILVADDEPRVRTSLRQMLEQGGHEVIEAVDGKQGLRQALGGQVDLVITDLVMPEKEGLETIQALRQEMPDIGIVAISGAFGGQFLKAARAMGADAALGKPLNSELLLATVAEVLQRRPVGSSRPGVV
jgi:PAS domain S-box-containing protein